MLGAPVAKALGPELDHGEHIAFMHMGCEALVAIAGVQQLDATQPAGRPEAGIFLLSVHGSLVAPIGSILALEEPA